MDQKTLEKNLANMERELLALQTAHDVGLGAVGFYNYSGQFNTFGTGFVQFAILLIDVLSGEKSDPLITVYESSIKNNNAQGFGYVERISAVKFMFYNAAINTQSVQTMYYRVISSSRLSVRNAVSEQDYEDWLNE